MRVFKIFRNNCGPDVDVAIANETGVVNIANNSLLFGAKSEKHRITFGLIQNLEQAITFLKEENFVIEEQTDIVWNEGYITFVGGI